MKRYFDGFLNTKREAFIQISLLVGIIVLLNVLASSVIWRLDLTDDKRYTLSKASLEIARNIEDPITVTAYFSKDLPPQLLLIEREFKEFLDEFRAYSDGKLEYSFLNPNEDEETERKAQQSQIQPVLIDVRERDQVSQKRAYLGAVFQYGENREVLPVIQPGSGMEYAIASTVKRLTNTNKKVVGLLQGHGEPGREQMPQLIGELEQQYTVQLVNELNDTLGVAANIDVLLVIAPKEKLDEVELFQIDQYLMRGGKVIFAASRVDSDIQRGMATLKETGLEKLLASYRIPVQGDLLRDANGSTISVRRQQGMFSFMNQVKYPYLPIITNFADHPITKGLNAMVMQFTSTLDVTLVDTTKSLTVLASSSDRSGTARGSFNLDPFQEWKTRDFLEERLPVAALVEGRFTSAFEGHETYPSEITRSVRTALVVIGSGSFLVNGEGQQQQRMPDDNISLVVNAIDYLADDTGLISLRTKGVTSRPLDMLEDSTKSTLKYANVFVPILMIVLYGVVRYQRRRALRRKWMESGI